MSFYIVLCLAVVAFCVLTAYVVLNMDPDSLVGRWCALMDAPVEWVSGYWPPILWPLSWPLFAVAYALAVPLAMLSSRLFVPQKFRRSSY